MRKLLIGLLAAGLTVMFGACRGIDEGDEFDPEHDGGTDTDVDSDVDSDADSDGDSDSDWDCESEELPEMDDIYDCPDSWGWPCVCQNTEYCDSGAPCLGYWADLGICASFCQLEDPPTCPDVGPLGMDGVEICDTYLYDGCLCLLSGCVEDIGDCPWGQRCVEPSCIAYEPGCEQGEGETKVCFPDNW